MPPRAYIPPDFARDPFRGSLAVSAGYLTPNQLRAPSLRRVFRDVYVDASVPDTPALRIASARLIVPDNVVISGAAAALIHGANVGVDPTDLEVTARYDERFRSRAGIKRRHAQLDEGDVVEVGGLAVTSPIRTAFDLSRRFDLVRGTAAVDAMLNRGLILPEEFKEYVAGHRGWTGVPKSRLVSRWMDGGAESVRETRLRLTMVWGGLPPPETQVVVYDEFNHVIARLDCAYRKHRVGAEYDGAHHFETSDAVVRDISRYNDLAAYGWKNFRFVSRDFRTPLVIVRRLGSALGLEPRVSPWFSQLSC